MTGSFADSIWTTGGTYFICYRSANGAFVSDTFTDPKSAVACALEKSRQGDVWYAPAVFAPGATRRTQDNVLSVGAFWLDIDVGGDSAYPDAPAAAAELKRFCSETGLPKPTIVSSGNGLHVYWLLDTRLSGDEWRDRARSLRDLCTTHNLLADHSRTHDSASLLRLPGTLNHKTEVPKPVELLVLSEPMSVDKLPHKPRAAVDNSMFDLPAQPMPPSYGAVVATKCSQLAQFRDLKGNVSEPIWYASLGVLAFCEDGDTLAHEWSSGHPEYSPADTDEKLEHWEASAGAPTTCEHFKTINPEGCQGCPFADKVRSPISLGISAPAPESAKADSWACNIAPCWVVTDTGVYKQATDDADDGPKRILEDSLILTELGRVGLNGAEAVAQWRTPKGTQMQSALPLATLADDKSLTTWLLDRAITGFSKTKDVRMYLKDFAQHLQRLKDADMIINRFGWADTSHSTFFVGSRQITATAISQGRIANNVPRTMGDALHSVGSAEEWAAVTEVFADTSLIIYALPLLVAAASPIFSIVNVSGGVLSLAGRSGAGKTTSAMFAASIYGHPEALILSPQGTLNSKGEFFRIANNLPIIIDDITSESRSTSALVYMAANGRAKERLTRSGDIRGQDSWALSLITTTNSPLYDLPPNILGEAEKRRVLELHTPAPIGNDIAGKLHSAMNNNYGVVADKYIPAVIHYKDWIAKRFDKAVSDVFSLGIEDSHRFGVWLLAGALTAGDILATLGLIKFDHNLAVRRAASVLTKSMSRAMLDPVECVDEAVRAWINANIGAVAICKGASFLHVPDRQILARADISTDEICIPNHRLKEIAVEWGLPGTAVDEWKTANHATQKVARLGGGRTVSERCTVLKMPDTINFKQEDSDGIQ